LIEDKMVVQH